MTPLYQPEYESRVNSEAENPDQLCGFCLMVNDDFHYFPARRPCLSHASGCELPTSLHSQTLLSNQHHFLPCKHPTYGDCSNDINGNAGPSTRRLLGTHSSTLVYRITDPCLASRRNFIGLDFQVNLRSLNSCLRDRSCEHALIQACAAS